MNPIANPRASILIVEGENVSADDLESRLINIGYSVCGKSADGPAAFKIIEAKSPELVIMELAHQGMDDGIRAAKVIREKWEIPVVFITDIADDHFPEKAKSASPYGYLSGTFEEKDLIVCLELAFQTAAIDAKRREAENRAGYFSMMIEQSMDAVIRADQDFRITYLNRAAEELYGFKSNEVLGLNISVLEAEPDSVAMDRDLFQAQATGQSYVNETLHRRKDGSTFICRFAISLLRDTDGGSLGYVCSLNDVTESTRNREALRESEERFRLLYRNAPMAYQSLDEDGRFIEINQAWLKTLGYSKEEVLGRSFGDFLVPEWREHFKTNFPRFKAMGEILGVEFEMVKKDGALILVTFDGKIGKFPDGTFKQTHCILQDITDKRKYELKLRKSEENFRNAFEYSGIGMALVSPDGQFLSVNNAVTQILGYSSDDILKMSFDDVTHPDFREESHQKYMGMLRGDYNNYQQEKRYIHKDGSTVWGILNISLIRDEDGQPRYSIAQLQDITERRISEVALKESEERYRLLFENSETLISIYNERGDCLMMNNTVAQWFGGAPEDLIGKNFSELHPAQAEEYTRRISDVINTGIVGIFEDKVVFPEEVRWLHSSVYPVRDATGRNVAAQIMSRDITERKRAEEALSESERRYRNIFENAREGIFQSVPEGRFIRVNPAMATMCGYETPEDMVESISDIATQYYASPQDRAYYQQVLREQGHIENFEINVKKKNGDLIWVSNSTRVILNDQGEIEFYEGMVSDITGRKKVEKELVNQNHLLNTLLDTLPVGVFMVEVETERPLLANKRAVELLGRGIVPEARRNSIADVYKAFVFGTNEPYPINRMPIVKALDGEHAHVDDMVINHPNGQKILLEVFGSPVKDDDGNIIAGLVSFMDITERKQALVELERIFDMSLDMISVADIKTEMFIKVNPAFTRVLGYTEKELLERPYTDFVHPDDLEKTRRVVEEKLKLGINLLNFENRYLDKHGEYHWFRWVAQPIPEEGLSYAVTHDITEAKRAEKERSKLLAQLQQAQKMEAVGTLAGGVAHDFNNLLQVISGYTQLLLLDTAGGTQAHDLLNSILSAGKRAKDLIHQLLLFSRKLETQKKPINLNREVDQAVKILERTIPRMIDIQLHMSRQLWTINADPVQIEQILLNLGGNAADAMPDGGKLLIETANLTLTEDDARVQINARPGDYVILAVSDTGMGMSEEVAEHIFEPFFTTKEFGKGTGLGLASAYGIVKNHGGYINCYSEPGLGTTFKIYLPAYETTTADKKIETEVEIFERGSETVLLVDDEEHIRSFASQALKNFGYSVITAPSGEEALKIYDSKDNKPDLVILDIGMPGMGGRSCLQEILKRNPEATVLIASGYSINDQVSDILELGAAGFIAKPYQLKDLLTKIREILNKNS